MINNKNLIYNQFLKRFGENDGFHETGEVINLTKNISQEISNGQTLEIFSIFSFLDGIADDFYVSFRSATTSTPTSENIIGELQDENNNVLMSKTLVEGRISFVSHFFEKNHKYKIVIKRIGQSSAIYTINSVRFSAHIYKRINQYLITE